MKYSRRFLKDILKQIYEQELIEGCSAKMRHAHVWVGLGFRRPPCHLCHFSGSQAATQKAKKLLFIPSPLLICEIIGVTPEMP